MFELVARYRNVQEVARFEERAHATARAKVLAADSDGPSLVRVVDCDTLRTVLRLPPRKGRIMDRHEIPWKVAVEEGASVKKFSTKAVDKDGEGDGSAR